MSRSHTRMPARRHEWLDRLLLLVLPHLPKVNRYQRYVRSIAPVLGAIWLATAAYLLLVPRTYTSEFSLIVPGSGVGSSLNVESIGQAQSSSNSAFSSPTLSPTENYKQLLSADITRRAAAKLTGGRRPLSRSGNQARRPDQPDPRAHRREDRSPGQGARRCASERLSCAARCAARR